MDFMTDDHITSNHLDSIHQLVAKYLGIHQQAPIPQELVMSQYQSKLKRYPPHLFPHKFRLFDLCKDWLLGKEDFMEAVCFHPFHLCDEYFQLYSQSHLLNDSSVHAQIHEENREEKQRSPDDIKIHSNTHDSYHSSFIYFLCHYLSQQKIAPEQPE
jgi:hypothetical protein